MTVYVADARARVQRLVAVAKMATVFDGYTTEERRSVVRFLWAKGLNTKVIHKDIFLFTVGSVCRVKRFTTGSRNSLKDTRKSQMMPEQVRKWLKQQSKDFYTSGFDALVKRWNTCINVGGGYVEK
jgi:hypothetical protein